MHPPDWNTDDAQMSKCFTMDYGALTSWPPVTWALKTPELLISELFSLYNIFKMFLYIFL